jgi:mRNA interferase MazF
LRYRIASRDKLDKTSDILCDQIRALDNQRILDALLTKLTYKELLEIDKQVKIILDIEV